MSEQEPLREIEENHPLITLGLLTIGTQVGSALVQRMAKRPVVLFAMGIAVGVYSYKHRKEILRETHYLSQQGKALLSVNKKENDA